MPSDQSERRFRVEPGLAGDVGGRESADTWRRFESLLAADGGAPTTPRREPLAPQAPGRRMAGPPHASKTRPLQSAASPAPPSIAAESRGLPDAEQAGRMRDGAAGQSEPSYADERRRSGRLRGVAMGLVLAALALGGLSAAGWLRMTWSGPRDVEELRAVAAVAEGEALLRAGVERVWPGLWPPPAGEPAAPPAAPAPPPEAIEVAPASEPGTPRD